ncbi:hypothetical protein Zm00014a_025622 [Zea mays]|uniref:Uncharacterized protein n=1 Tax=Zea mays TaxID=4577 RepID=A0A317Y9N5_MAIZE|nr:hypothetical protein Zm00014a_025622 [Zea mays]
MLEYTKANS